MVITVTGPREARAVTGCPDADSREIVVNRPLGQHAVANGHRYAELDRGEDGGRMEDLRAEGRELGGLVVAQELDGPGLGHDAGIAGEDALDVGPDLDLGCADRGSEEAGAVVRASAPEGGRRPGRVGAYVALGHGYHAGTDEGQHLLDGEPGYLVRQGLGRTEARVRTDHRPRVYPWDAHEGGQDRRGQNLSSAGEDVQALLGEDAQEGRPFEDVAQVGFGGGERRLYRLGRRAPEEIGGHDAVPDQDLGEERERLRLIARDRGAAGGEERIGHPATGPRARGGPPSRLRAAARAATPRSRAASATEVPPNFITTAPLTAAP